MNFKEDVEFYLKNNKGFNYYCFDIENGSIAEEDGSEEESGSDSEASVKTKEKCGASVKTKEKKVCPKCGKKPCECEASLKTNTHGEEDDDGWHASLKTNTHGEEDDDGWHASTNTAPSDFGATPEEIEMIKLIKKNGGLGGKFVAETPEEKEMLKLATKIAGSKAAVKNDHTAGFAPSIETKKSIKEEILSKL